jgi:hypothetical protein
MLHLYTTIHNQPTCIRRSIYIPAVRRVCRTSSPPPQAPAGIKSPDAGRRHGLRVSSAVINFGGLANPRFSHSRKEFRASAVLPAPTAAAALRPKTGSDRPSACQSCDIYDDTTGWQLSSTSNCKISATRAKHFPSNFRTYTAAATTKQLDSRQLLLVRACVRSFVYRFARARAPARRCRPKCAFVNVDFARRNRDRQPGRSARRSARRYISEILAWASFQLTRRR